MAGKEAVEGDGQDTVALLAGTALRVYLALLRSRRPLGVREVQKIIGARSPSTAHHHLERLVSLGLAKKTSSGYVAVKPRGLLELYTVVRGRLIPRSAGLAVFTTAATIAYTLAPGSDPAASILLAIASLFSLHHFLVELRAVKRLETG